MNLYESRTIRDDLLDHRRLHRTRRRQARTRESGLSASACASFSNPEPGCSLVEVLHEFERASTASCSRVTGSPKPRPELRLSSGTGVRSSPPANRATGLAFRAPSYSGPPTPPLSRSLEHPSDRSPPGPSRTCRGSEAPATPTIAALVHEFTQSPVGSLPPNGQDVVFELTNIFGYDDQGRIAEEYVEGRQPQRPSEARDEDH
jgi:hypothetical protein